MSASRMDASPDSMQLAARMVPQRPSRSAARRTPVIADAEDALAAATTTTTTSVVTTVAVARSSAVAASATKSSTTRTTVKRRPTTTTTKPKPKAKATTTTVKPAPKAASGPPQMQPFTAPSPASSTGQTESGQATWYDTQDPQVCAHKTIPLGTIITVTDVDNGKSVTCKVGDRGPYVDGRVVDLSPEAFSQLAPLSTGVINVKLTW